ncbi:MAG: hypothetical protein IKG21_03695 [Atopobiaceae bacterium]|nr:hypothetical protein [Atopobiaceae bacterium]
MSSIGKSTTLTVANDPVESRQKFAIIADGQYEMIAGYPDLLTPKHIAALSGFSVDYVRRLCREHKPPPSSSARVPGSCPNLSSSLM